MVTRHRMVQHHAATMTGSVQQPHRRDICSVMFSIFRISRRVIVARGVLITGIVLASLALNCGRKEDAANGDRIAKKEGKPVVTAELLYLPSEDKTKVTVLNDSVIVERTNDRDSCISRSVKKVDEKMRPCLDSLTGYLDGIPAGEYKKRGVIDGTKIRFSYKGKDIYCDRCLSDFVLRQAGMESIRPSGQLLQIKEAVRYLNEIIMLAEKREDKAEKEKKAVAELRKIYKERYKRTIQFPGYPPDSN